MQDLVKRDIANSVDPQPGEDVYIKSINQRGIVVSLHAEPDGLMYRVKYNLDEDGDSDLYMYCWRHSIIRLPQ
jgi:hypothetical protein